MNSKQQLGSNDISPWHRCWLHTLLFALVGCILGISYLVPGTTTGACTAWLATLCLTILVHLTSASTISFFAFGLGIQATVFYWLAPIIGYYGDFSAPAAWVLHCCYILFAALQLAGAGVLYRCLSKTVVHAAGLSLPCAWLAAEVLFPGLIPWMLGHTQLPLPWLAAISDIAGVPLISFFMVWWCELLFLLAISSSRNSLPNSRKVPHFGRGYAATALCFSIGCVFAYSVWRTSILDYAIKRAPSLRVAMIQPNFDALKDFSPSDQENNIGAYKTLSFPFIVAGNLDLLVWPESSVWNDYSVALSGVTPGSPDDPFPGLNVPLLFGGQASVPSDSKAKLPLLHNSVYLKATDGTFTGKYHKQRLFPFSELVPMSQWFPALDTLIARSYRVTPGEKATKGLTFPKKSPGDAAISIAVAICYEDMWSDILRDQIALGGNTILAALSNDAWFLKSPAAIQHYLLARWRAVELRRYLLRATVDGVSAIIDPQGMPISQVPPFTSGSLLSSDVKALETMSPFARIGPLPLQFIAALICLFGTATALHSTRKA